LYLAIICVKLKGERRNAYKIFVGKPEGKKPREIRRRRWEDNIRMDLKRNKEP
jgi:hypothetical protein